MSRYEKGFIYVLTNEVMPDVCKIGITKNLDRRVNELSSHTGVALPFDLYCAYEFRDYKKLEKDLHKTFEEYRVNPNREFFNIHPERVKKLLDRIIKEENQNKMHRRKKYSRTSRDFNTIF